MLLNLIKKAYARCKVSLADQIHSLLDHLNKLWVTNELAKADILADLKVKRPLVVALS